MGCTGPCTGPQTSACETTGSPEPDTLWPWVPSPLSLFQATCEAPGHVGHHSHRTAYSCQHRCTLRPFGGAHTRHSRHLSCNWARPNRAGRTGRMPKGSKPLCRPDSWRQEQGCKGVVSDGGGAGSRMANYTEELISGKSSQTNFLAKSFSV